VRRLPLPALAVLPLLAQTDTATITGQVADPSGAVLPKAAIEAANQDTGLKHRADSNEAGVYVIPALPIGRYEVSASLQGFQTVRRSGVAISAGTRLRLDFQLKVGAVNEVVEVTAAVPLLESETSSLGQVVENTTITQMPLNGRNYQRLATLAPGVLPSRSRNFVDDAFSVNGANMWQNQFVLDGADNTNYFSGVVIASNQTVKPSVDAIQEFKMETHNFSAEFGRGGGAVIQVTTKSGTNQLHGSLFEFLRNDKLDANNFFNSGRAKPPFRQNQFGGTLGGPIRRDRMFFFASHQSTHIREKLTRLSRIPTAAQLQGNFQGVANIFDPATQAAGNIREPFPSNTIPQSRFDPVALRMVRLYPAPNRAGVQNFVFNTPRNLDDQQIDTRFDWRARDRDSLFVRYSLHDYERLEPGTLPLPASGGDTALRLSRAHAGTLSWTHVLANGRMVNEARVAYSRLFGGIDTPTREPLWRDFGFKAPSTATTSAARRSSTSPPTPTWATATPRQTPARWTYASSWRRSPGTAASTPSSSGATSASSSSGAASSTSPAANSGSTASSPAAWAEPAWATRWPTPSWASPTRRA
jgi:hypothetical protein